MKAENKPVELDRLWLSFPSAARPLGREADRKPRTAAHFPIADGGSQAPSPEQDLTV